MDSWEPDRVSIDASIRNLASSHVSVCDWAAVGGLTFQDGIHPGFDASPWAPSLATAVRAFPIASVAPTMAPAAPTGLSATAGFGQVALAWDSVSSAAGYTVKRSTTAGGPYTPITPAGAATDTSYADPALTNGTTYYYVVTATNGIGEGPTSNEATPAVVVPGTTTLRINAGGGAYTDTAGNAWQADTAYTGGATWSFQGLNITGTADPELYRDVRYGGVGGAFSYTLPATPGSYTLKLHFVEGDGHASAPGLRTFNVLVNGTTALSSLDVAAAAGGIGKALDENIPVTVPAGGGGVTVTFQTLTYGAMVSAIELVPAGT